MLNRISFMQGRLVDKIDGKIQAFPLDTWRDEFPIAQTLGLQWIEWTIDDSGLEHNPFCTEVGQKEILQLSSKYAIGIGSVTGDCFMQSPFWKASGHKLAQDLHKLDLILAGSAKLGARQVVIPLVDNGSLDTLDQEKLLLNQLISRSEYLRANGVGIAFESDFAPKRLAAFIAQFPDDIFGINYDIGNSASLGFDPYQEFSAYGKRIHNVHMKDRVLGGTTVELGTGNANFTAVFENLAAYEYSGLVVLQTARAKNTDHSGVLAQYIAITQSLMEKYLGS